MDGQPVASFRRLCGGDDFGVAAAAAAVVVVESDVFSSSAGQREDARMDSAAAMMPNVLSDLLSDSFLSKPVGFCVAGLR